MKDKETYYTIVAGKDEKDLPVILEYLKKYAVKKESNSEIDIKNHFEGFTTYITIKEKGYTKILNKYLLQEKIYVQSASSKSYIAEPDKFDKERIKEKGCTKWGIIVDRNYKERKQLYMNIKSEDVQERIKDKKVENLTEEDIFERYIVYGTAEELKDPEIQKLLIEHGYIDELTSIITSVITDNEVIDKILTSNFVEEENILVKVGKIKNIYFDEDDELPSDTNWMYIEFIDKNGSEIKLKDIHIKTESQDFENELDKYKDDELTILATNINNEMKLKCVLKRGE